MIKNFNLEIWRIQHDKVYSIAFKGYNTCVERNRYMVVNLNM